jgi:hypothetical protein
MIDLLYYGCPIIAVGALVGYVYPDQSAAVVSAPGGLSRAFGHWRYDRQGAPPEPEGCLMVARTRPEAELVIIFSRDAENG